MYFYVDAFLLGNFLFNCITMSFSRNMCREGSWLVTSLVNKRIYLLEDHVSVHISSVM